MAVYNKIGKGRMKDMDNSGMMSVILPAYNETANIEKSYRAITEVLRKKKISYELVYVNDGSADGTWDEICRVWESAENPKEVAGICFSRNFGKEAAIMAGLAYASGDVCVVMDCDLQHPPEILTRMYELWQQGYEVVEGVKRSRGKETGVHRACARIFYKLMSAAMGINMENASDFRLLDRKVVRSVLSMPERSMFFRAASSWVGYKRTEVEFDVQERENGVSKWSKLSLVKYALKNIAAFSTFPLQLVTITGGLTFLGALVLAAQILWRYCGGTAVEGFTTVIMLLLIVSSVMMISIGILGYYIAKIYEEVKRRPMYIVSRVIKG